METKKDWFEFLLDLNLLDSYFKQEDPDPNACSLIVQFLYHANLTEQLYGNVNTNGSKANDLNPTGILSQPASPMSPASPGPPPPQLPPTTPSTATTATQPQQYYESKGKRIKVLRILAIKAAAIIKWNLKKFEKEVPIAVMSDLLQILLRHTLKNNDIPHNQLDLKQLDKAALFSLQLLHRWCIRTSINAKYPTKPSKNVPLNVPGIINPVQHMKEANENILKHLLSSTQESVEFLHKCLDLGEDLQMPTTHCFANISSETGEYELDWSKSEILELNNYKTEIKYDLAQFYFMNENYLKCYKLLSEDENMCELISKNSKLKSYCVDYYELLFASASIIQKYDAIKNTESHLPCLNSIENKIETCIRNEFKGVFDLLINDNRKCELTISYRVHLENESLRMNLNAEIQDQIISCNLVRFLIDDLVVYLDSYDLTKLNYLSQAILLSKPTKLKAKLNINLFIKLNYKKFTKKCQQELLADSTYANIIKSCLNFNKTSDSGIDYEVSPASPDSTSTGSTKSTAVQEYIQMAIKTTDPLVLRHTITNYNQIVNVKGGLKSSNKLEWNVKMILNKYQFIQNNIFTNNLNKYSVTDNDIIVISLCKAIKLDLVRKYDLASKMLKMVEDTVKDSQFLSKFIVNELNMIIIKKQLFDNIEPKYFHNDQLTNNLKNYLNNTKLDVDGSVDSLRLTLAYLLTVGEFRFIQAISDQYLKKPKSVITGYFELCKKFIKICEMDKSTMNRKISRELWDCIIEIFTDTIQTKRQTLEPQSSSQDGMQTSGSSFTGGNISITRESQNACLNRESFRKFIKLIKNPQILSIILSILSTLYNISDSSCNFEISSEYRHLWASSLGGSSTINLNSVIDTLQMFVKHCLTIDPFNSIWLRTIADLYYSQQLFNDSINYYLQIIICDTRYFTVNVQRVLNEKLLKPMIRSCLQLNKHTQVALLSQYLPVVDYTVAFKCLQEKLVCDQIDLLYSCIWDVTLFEYLIHINHQKSYYAKRDLAMKLCSQANINASNPVEIKQKTIDVKRTLLFLNLIKYYLI